MPTSSFDREIVLDELSIKRLINKIENDKKRTLKRKRIDVNEKLKESEKILERLFKKEGDTNDNETNGNAN